MPLPCTSCDRKFSSKHSLSNHKYMFHSTQGGGRITDQSNGRANSKKDDIQYQYDSDNSWAVSTYAGSSTENDSSRTDSDSEDEKNWKKEKKELETKHKKTLKSLKKKIKLYVKHNGSLQSEEQERLNPLYDAIFNEPTMAEITKIEKLVGKYEFDEIINDHMETLQNVFMAISNGVIPVTRPQRDEITDSQRKLMESIETADEENAGIILRENVQEVVNLFAIIEDSLKLIRKSFHKFPLKTSDDEKSFVSSEDSDSDVMG